MEQLRAAPTLTTPINFFGTADDGDGDDSAGGYGGGGGGMQGVETELANGRCHPPTHPVEDGFALRAHVSAVANWYDFAGVRSTLYPEYENLVRSLVPEAEHVFVGGHICRNPEMVNQRVTTFGEAINTPHKFMHCDFGNGSLNPATGRGRYAEYFYDWLTPGLAEPVSMTAIDKDQGKDHGLSAEEIRKYRVIVLNIWRGILPQGVDRDPLCVVDPASAPADLTTVMRDAPVPGYNGQRHSSGVAFTVGGAWEGQRVVHYPKMSKDEVMIFKTYDSAEGFVPTLHGSFVCTQAIPLFHS